MKKLIFALCALGMSSAMAASDLQNHTYDFNPVDVKYGVELQSPLVDGVSLNGGEDMLVLTNQICSVWTKGQYPSSIYASKEVKSQVAMGLSEDAQSLVAKKTTFVITSIRCY